MNKKPNTAIFSAGCFWGVQDYFDQMPGVTKTIVGYTGGHTKEPTYEEVCTDKTGHAEAIKITFDSDKTNFDLLLKHFFAMHDPTQYMKQGPDVGSQYRSAVFYSDDDQKERAEKYIAFLDKSNAYDKPIVTEVTKAGEFYKAEEYHQKYTEKTGHGGCHVRYTDLN